MKDIQTRADIDELMNRFYARAISDDVIGYIFTDVAKLDLKRHLPIIGDFWDSLLFGAGNYQKHGRNPLEVHAELNRKTPLEQQHFRRWLALFSRLVDETLSGERAEYAKTRAGAIANRMLNFVGGVEEGRIKITK